MSFFVDFNSLDRVVHDQVSRLGYPASDDGSSYPLLAAKGSTARITKEGTAPASEASTRGAPDVLVSDRLFGKLKAISALAAAQEGRRMFVCHDARRVIRAFGDMERAVRFCRAKQTVRGGTIYVSQDGIILWATMPATASYREADLACRHHNTAAGSDVSFGTRADRGERWACSCRLNRWEVEGVNVYRCAHCKQLGRYNNTGLGLRIEPLWDEDGDPVVEFGGNSDDA